MQKRPRFARFAAAMAHARATGAPELDLYDDELAADEGPLATERDQRPHDDQPAPYRDPPAAYDNRTAIDHGRPAADHDWPAPYDDWPATYEDEPVTYNGRPAVSYSPVVRPALRPLAPRSRLARGRAVLRWLGVVGCVLVVCLLLAGWLAWPESARLVSRWLAAGQSGEPVQAQTVLPAPAPPKPAADG